ncbi:alkaline phosphatase family protein [Phyllobacterium myrsinacearum]|uniref:Phospholipase C n=1 Tax=Phyllobacterium myrsinacearum TaxID=28101 RepID=A0A839EAD2_9HYPH|nr:alkaline phosphatase family protein [Phyllobacterium myrsinacearum]MBA8876843.1 phospholipase C [Phyllobacterium myrsinacearum]
MERRDFIKMLGIAGINTAAYAACSAYMQEALASSTVVNEMLSASLHCKEGSLADIEHVVILMQENRSFDHYFGTLRGVRGFGDPRPLKLQNGEPVWHQAQSDSSAQKIRPYELPQGDTLDAEGGAGGVFLQDPAHDYESGLAAWNGGLMDKWIPQKGIVSMAHYTERDIPLYFKLAKAFTICDSYFCSHNGATDTNRIYFWTGTSKGRYDNSHFPFANEHTELKRPDWKSYPEVLEDMLKKFQSREPKVRQELEKCVSWKFYQDGVGSDVFTGNYDNNPLEAFENFREKNTSFYKKSRTAHSVLRTDANVPSELEKDVVSGNLPAVSWIVAPKAFSEHAVYPPHFGEYYVNEILRALVANKEVWKKTALFITYDENGSFFDHVPPPVPPLSVLEAAVKYGFLTSVLSEGIEITATTLNNEGKEEGRDFNSENAYRGNPKGKDETDDEKKKRELIRPLGMGMRVPLLVISPWSAGGRVCSEVFDHTSFISFLDTWIEKRLGAKGEYFKGLGASNISAWRRAIAGDLTSTLDFDRGAAGAIDAFIDRTVPVKIFTEDEKKKAEATNKFSPDIKVVNADPNAKNPVAVKQDRTQCNLLPVDYDFQISFKIKPASATMPTPFLECHCINSGQLGVSFAIYAYDAPIPPMLISLEGKRPGGYPASLKNEFFPMNEQSDYYYAAHGPNGYLVEVRGNAQSATEAAFHFSYDITRDKDGKTLSFHFPNWPTANGTLKLVNAYTHEVLPVKNGTKRVDVATKDGWYDVSFVDAVNTDSKYLRRYAGHIENGKMSRTDPAIGMVYDEATRVYVPVAL